MIKKDEKKLIGSCPVCGRGNIIKYHGNYICTEHFTNADGHPRCTFSMPFNYRGSKLDDDIVKRLIETGETDFLEMESRNGNPYMAKIVIVKGKGIDIHPLKKELDVRCPKCGGRMFVTRQGYACENELKLNPTCDMFIGNKIANRFIYENETADFLKGKKVILDGFQSNAKIAFSGFLQRNDNGVTAIASKVGKCPSCGGDMLVGLRAFNCSNYKKGCTFNVYREYYGHALTADEIHKLLTDGNVDINCTDTYGNIFSYRLSIEKVGDKTVVKKVKFLNNMINKKLEEDGKTEQRQSSQA